MLWLCIVTQKIKNINFSFLLYNVFVGANKPNTKKKDFILYAPGSPPLNSRVKKSSLEFLFYTLGLIASIKNINKNEKIVNSVGFTKLAIKFCALLAKPRSCFC